MKKLSIANLATKEAYKRGYRVHLDGYVISSNGNIIKSMMSTKGYYIFCLRLNKRVVSLCVHKLQAYQKYGDELFEVDCVRHLNGNPLDNSWENIAIGSLSDNMRDIHEKIRKRKAIHASSFIKKHNHEEIIKFHEKCKSYDKTMKKFNISSKGTLHFILSK